MLGSWVSSALSDSQRLKERGADNNQSGLRASGGNRIGSYIDTQLPDGIVRVER